MLASRLSIDTWHAPIRPEVLARNIKVLFSCMKRLRFFLKHGGLE